MVHNVHDGLPRIGGDVAISFLFVGVQGVVADQDVGAQVGGEHDESVSEINPVALTVCQEALV